MQTSMPPLLLPLVTMTFILSPSKVQSWEVGEVTSGIEQFKESVQGLFDKVDTLSLTVRDLARQVMLQQYYVEEANRVNFNSGVKQIRHDSEGESNYYQAMHVGKTMLGSHDHANHMHTVGLGELTVVLNGVEFRTRHNDFMMTRASTTSTENGATEVLKFPEVPLSVKDAPDFKGQVMEMREYFRAFKTQNATHRNYTSYFTPHLCYMEGAWTLDKNLTEPFESDRHFVDAESWHDLMEKVRFNAISGSKNILENLAYLPTTIIQVDEVTGAVAYAQWNYRILCHPLKDDLPLKYLKPMDDMGSRVSRKLSFKSHLNSKRARFQLYEHDTARFTQNGTLLDKLFYEVPGRNNIITDDLKEDFEEKLYEASKLLDIELNTFKYQRRYRFDKPGAMGTRDVNRGYSDNFMYLAATTQPQIAPFRRQICGKKDMWINGKLHRNQKYCDYKYHRYTYAIPLEIIYLTPLFEWNPKNIPFFEKNEDVIGSGDDKRDGSEEAPYYGNGPKYYYRTPIEFLSDAEDDDRTLADTSKFSVHVLDDEGNAQIMVPSGQRIFTGDIDGGVGRIRLRYPIAPIAGEGSPVWKELNALRQTVVDAGIGNGDDNFYTFEMSMSISEEGLEHTHELRIQEDTLKALVQKGGGVDVTTTLTMNHLHKLNVRFDKDKEKFYYWRCDGGQVCWDQHGKWLVPLENIDFLKQYYN